MIWIPPIVALISAAVLVITGHRTEAIVFFGAAVVSWWVSIYFEAARIDQMYPKKEK